MGMMACYMGVEKDLLDELKFKSEDDLFETIEELEEECEVYDMDKLWDGVHFLLTGASATEPIANDLLSEAVVGTALFIEGEDTDYIAYIYPERVKEILSAMKDVDIDKMLEEFSPRVFAKNHIYPTIWIEKDKEKLREELAENFRGLKEFYSKMVEDKKGIVVSIY